MINELKRRFNITSMCPPIFSANGFSLPCLLFMIIIHTVLQIVKGQMTCNEDSDCPSSGYVCKTHTCDCERPVCEVPRLLGDPCSKDSDCFTTDLVCNGKDSSRVCRCRKSFAWDMKYNKCLKDDTYTTYDPVQNFIIPAIIVMSVGAMVYLGIKLFCNCGKLWRRRQSQLSRELDGMSASPHQQATWVASYRVFSPLNNSNQPSLHPPCMGLFVPNLSTSPPPYEEALKHKVILSSYQPTPAPPQVPLYTYEAPVSIEEDARTTPQRGLLVPATERDQTRPLRYYAGDGNTQVAAVWNNVRESAPQPDGPREVPVTNSSIFRDNRCLRGSRSSRQYHADVLTEGAT